MKLREQIHVALFAVVMAICAWISVPFPVPFTLQTFGVYAALLLLGGKKGTMAILLYIALGAVGLPVFSGFSGGVGALFGATGGYIWGFIFMGLLDWRTEKYIGDKTLAHALIMVAGTILCYSFGTFWFMRVYAAESGAIGVGTALSWCVIPFLLPDAMKLGLAFLLAGRVKVLTRGLKA